MSQRIPTFFESVWTHRYVFVPVVIIVFAITYTFLYVFDFVPNELAGKQIDEPALIQNNKGEESINFSQSSSTVAEENELPTRIVINKIGVDTDVYNPQSSDARVLDSYLTKGAVRYPGSGTPGKGNMFMFGHSTSIRVVQNEAYKAFNNLGTLEKGDEIRVYTESRVYTYRVRTVRQVKETEAWVDLSTEKRMLTISTCNTFGAKQDRHVVEADYIGSRVL